MVHRSGCLGFVAEAPEHLIVLHAGYVETHGLQGDGAANIGIYRAVDESHRPTAQFADDLVTSDLVHGGDHASFDRRMARLSTDFRPDLKGRIGVLGPMFGHSGTC